uniref:Calcium homeostasis endoplasmic reticulum protein n=1 Tax=Cacopsylla melanoneura TaxID=428564 RepID=A0A8D8T028_9HEMI
MDLPKPPADVEAKNIIDKLAQFVARNGAEFEQMTKEKQQGNAKFAFLFGGEFFNYYQYRVTSEQAILKIKGNQHQQQEAPPPPSIEPQHPTENKPAVWLTNTPAPQPQNTVTVEQLTQQQSTLNEQIHQSESNLKAQHESIECKLIHQQTSHHLSCERYPSSLCKEECTRVEKSCGRCCGTNVLQCCQGYQ